MSDQKAPHNPHWTGVEIKVRPCQIIHMNERRIFQYLSPLLALLFLTTGAIAQDGDDEKRRDTWSAIVDLAFSGASGNDQTTLLTTGFKIAHLRTEAFELEFTGNVRYGRSEGREVARNLKSGLKMDIMPKDRWSPFISITGERDPFRKLDLRSNSGAGVKFSFWKASNGSAAISGAILHSYDNYTSGDGAHLDSRHSARWSWRFTGRRRLGESIWVDNVTFYQPVWDHSSEYLVAIDTSVRVPMNKHIALMLSHSYERDSMPPEGVHKDDHVLKAGLTIETRW